MTTRSHIIVKIADEKYRSIYCHWDGDTVGDVLRQHYNTRERAFELILQGDVSSLGPTIEQTEFLETDYDMGTDSSRGGPSIEYLMPKEGTIDFLHVWQDGKWETTRLTSSGLSD